jgi:acyl carrier protein
MNTAEILKQLTPIFHEVLDNEKIVLTPELSANDVEEWDSLSHIRLIVSIEEHFSIRFSLTKISELKNVGELVELIQQSLPS